MLKKIVDILSKYTKVDSSLISECAVLTSDLGLSSYDVVNIVADFEDTFDIEIPDKDIRKFQTVKDILEYIETVQQ